MCFHMIFISDFLKFSFSVINHFLTAKSISVSVNTAIVMSMGEEEEHIFLTRVSFWSCSVLISFWSVNPEYCQLYPSYATLVVIVQQAAVFISQCTSDLPGFSFPDVSVASTPGRLCSTYFVSSTSWGLRDDFWIPECWSHLSITILRSLILKKKLINLGTNGLGRK